MENAEIELGDAAIEIKFADMVLVLDASGAIYFPATGTLLVSDLHLEKGSYFAARRTPLPVYDTVETLNCLDKVIKKYQPRQVICLGDSFHDFKAEHRIEARDAQCLNDMCISCEWVWVLGNHDKFFPGNIKGSQVGEFKLGNITLSHEPTGVNFEICGHFHPKARVSIHGHKLSGRAFIYDSNLLVMPSFGAFTGGLYTDSPVIEQLFTGKIRQFMIYNKKLWQL